jgi:hypothetical protein
MQDLVSAERKNYNRDEAEEYGGRFGLAAGWLLSSNFSFVRLS